MNALFSWESTFRTTALSLIHLLGPRFYLIQAEGGARSFRAPPETQCKQLELLLWHGKTWCLCSPRYPLLPARRFQRSGGRLHQVRALSIQRESSESSRESPPISHIAHRSATSSLATSRCGFCAKTSVERLLASVGRRPCPTFGKAVTCHTHLLPAHMSPGIQHNSYNRKLHRGESSSPRLVFLTLLCYSRLTRGPCHFVPMLATSPACANPSHRPTTAPSPMLFSSAPPAWGSNSPAVRTQPVSQPSRTTFAPFRFRSVCSTQAAAVPTWSCQCAGRLAFPPSLPVLHQLTRRSAHATRRWQRVEYPSIGRT